MPAAHPDLPKTTARGLAYDDRGHGPTLVTVHGGPGTDHRLFRPFLDPLAADLRLVSFDLPGHGRSRPADDDGLASMAEAIDEVRTAVGADSIALLGSSYGGFLSLTYALAHPGAVTALVLVDTSASYGFREESLRVAERRGTAAMLAALRRLWDGSLTSDAEFRRAWREILPLYFHRLPRAEIDALADRTSYTLETRRRILPTLQRYDVRDRLGEIGVPALVVVGRHDWITSVGQSEELAAGLPRGELIVFEESGHYPFIEEPDRFLAVIRDWLARHVRGVAGETAERSGNDGRNRP